ncbi:MAG: NADH:ubiquinone reductase (Na(+)-transporting) subunit E [Clostridium sp.]|jgi:Na+-transporting NADH:ubiquinone oxidoreductase subunit E|nr:NADH:ubiquinone reductase (Na(+)-transporting) subunit E [Clostridium sp.]
MGVAPEISPIVIFFASIFTSNMILANFLGMCSYLSVSSEFKTASGLGKAVVMVLVITNTVNWLLNKYVIIPFKLEAFSFIVYIMVIAAIVQILEMFLDRYLPDLHAKLGIFLPLITVNCAVLGSTLFQDIRNYSLLQSILFNLGSGIGWWMAISMLAAIKEKIAKNKMPRGLQGTGISFIITGIMALAFIGFSGIFVIQ